MNNRAFLYAETSVSRLFVCYENVKRGGESRRPQS